VSEDLETGECTFLRERLTLVEDWLSNPDRDFIPAGHGKVHLRTKPASNVNLTYEREARLLRKLLVRTREGQVLITLKAWRRHLGGFLREHREHYKEMQDAHDGWWDLPWHEQQSMPKPPKPPPARYVDYEGAPWIIDDRLLALLDDLIKRLQKWGAEP
jgi:hypothetical protein